MPPILILLSYSQLSSSLKSLFSPMVPELEKPRVTEIQVRMDCNGCVQKIKKALHGINGIYDLYIDFPQQKLTVIGWADPEKIVKAVRKTRKTATLCSHTEPPDQAAAPPAEPPPDGGAPQPAAEAENPPPAPADASPPPEPPKDPPPPPPENPPPEKPSPSPIAVETNNTNQPSQTHGPKDVGEVHVIYHQPPDYGYRYGYGHGYSGHWNRFLNGHSLPPEPRYPTGHGLATEPPPPHPPQPPQPIYVTHSYNTYRPSPYVTEYQYVQTPPHQTIYSRMDQYNEDYHENSRSGNITSVFSDENPNACSIA